MFDWLRSLAPWRARSNAALLRQAEEALRAGAPETARTFCAEVLDRAGDHPHALSLMANIAADQKEVEEGLRWANRALAADPAFAAAHYAMARVREQAGRLDLAEASYRSAIELDPGHARAHNNLGCLLSHLERHEDALACFRRALELDPGQPEANQNFAALTGDAAAHEIAIEGYLRQTESDPTDARAFNNLASTYAGLGRNREALACLERAIALEPDRAEAHYSRGLLLLSEGDYAAGWDEYQWRWRLDNLLGAPARRFSQPMWDGRDLGDGALFIHGELALGEAVQFARYGRLAAGRCGAVIVECASRMKPLLQGVEGIARVTTPEEPVPAFAAHVPFFALPRIFGTTLENMPWDGPYIHPDPARAAACRALVDEAAQGRRKVGLSWSGNPKNPYNRYRSVPFAELERLFSVAGTAFFGLQKEGLPAGETRLLDLTAHERDLLDTAAYISHLDLVITIDSMICHLAGAMGKPVWVLLTRVVDWRQHVGRSDNPWYPSMRLYRQPRDGDWPSVIGQAALDLRAGRLA
jgi:tetratricopeptide (TPR) repeat protein